MKYERLTRRNVVPAEINLDYDAKPSMEIVSAFDGMRARGYVIDRLFELENKIENGTLAELPCKIGDTVYEVNPYGDMCEKTIKRIFYETDDMYFGKYAIGESIFLTLEDAEKAQSKRRKWVEDLEGDDK